MESSEEYYSRTWESASIAYQQRGFYRWCIERVPKGTKVLEIGTGIGIATLDLMDSGYTVSSLEENLHCFEKARKRFLESTHNVNFLMSTTEARQHENENNLIKSNFITDWNDVINTIKYDTVVCWFVGVHQNAHINPALRDLGYMERDFGLYRDLIYNRIFQAVSLRLVNGNIISLVERTNVLTSEQIREEQEWFEDNYDLSKYGLKLDKIEQLPIGDITQIPGIKMVPVKEGALPINQESMDAALLSYTISKIG